MSRIEQAWRRLAPNVLDEVRDAVSIELYPAEQVGPSPGSIPVTPPRIVVPPATQEAPGEPVAAPPRSLTRHDEPRVSAVKPVPVAHPIEGGADGTAAGLVQQCARLVDVAQGRARESALNVVVVTTPVPNVYAAQTSIHVARLLAASKGESVMLADASAGDPHLSALLEFEGLAGDGRAVHRSISDMPLIQLATVNAEHHALAGCLRAIAEDAGVKWVVAHAPAFVDMPDDSALHAMVRLGEGVILVLEASTPTPVIGRAVASVGRERLLGTVLVGI
jgi:hypothetical protein